MSTTEVAGKQEPKKSPQDASQILNDTERATMQRYLANPLDFPPEFRSWLEGFMETAIPSSASFTALATSLAFPVGRFSIAPEDLTANTSEYVWTDSITGLQFLYCNGAAVSQTTYASLYAAWGASKWLADSGSNFYLPDCRGRSLWFCGTNGACDLGDNDGVTEANRQPKHTHTDSLTLPNHIHGPSGIVQPGGGGDIPAGSGYGQGNTGNPTTNPSIDGSVGSGMSGSDAVAHYFIGSLVVRF